MKEENKKIIPQPMPATAKKVEATKTPANNVVQNPTPLNTKTNETQDSQLSQTKTVAEEVKIEAINPTDGSNTPVQTVVAPNSTSSVTPAVEYSTNKKKSSNFLFFLVIIILLVITFFIDNVVDFLTEDNYQYLNGITPDSSSSNLVNGFIKVGENNSFIKLEKIKFYNFRQTDSGVVSLDFISDKSISKPENLEIYVELYNSNQELLYKELFNPESKIENGVVTQYSMYVSNDVYLAVFYAKTVIYTKAEKASTQSLSCTYTIKNNNIDLIYKNTYNFINNELNSYDVSKSYTSTSENAEVLKYKAEIKEEYLDITKYNITNNYKDNLLTYTISLENYPEGYTPLYSKGTVMKTISNKEKLKKWTCE